MCRLTFRPLLAPSIAFALTVTALSVSQAQTYTNLYSFNGQHGGKLPYAGVTLGPRGNLYGTTSQGGPGDYGTVYRWRTRAAAGS
jgi:uncharacterized repeat protein (TIGR03803 family)